MEEIRLDFSDFDRQHSVLAADAAADLRQEDKNEFARGLAFARDMYRRYPLLVQAEEIPDDLADMIDAVGGEGLPFTDPFLDGYEAELSALASEVALEKMAGGGFRRRRGRG